MATTRNLVWGISNRTLLHRALQAGLFLVVGFLTWQIGISPIFPPFGSTETRHAVPYLPAQYELVERVTNKFVEGVGFGGAGGLGAPQIDRSLDAYQRNERPGKHFLSFTPTTEGNNLNYWDVGEGRVVHAQFYLPSPTHEVYGNVMGRYWAKALTIVGNEVVAQRQYRGGPGEATRIVGSIVFGVVAVLVGMFALWLGLNTIFESIDRRRGSR